LGYAEVCRQTIRRLPSFFSLSGAFSDFAVVEADS
jgi:hypothetical protein